MFAVILTLCRKSLLSCRSYYLILCLQIKISVDLWYHVKVLRNQ